MDTPDHCEECEEVEEKAQGANPDTLTLDQAGDGWAALHNFLNDEGFLYYFPAFIRLCIETDMDDGFLPNFCFAVTYEGAANSRLNACSPAQRKLVHDFMVWYRDTYPEITAQGVCEDDLDNAIKIWSGG